MKNIFEIKKDFPILSSNITYLDNSATTQKPSSVIDGYKEFYENSNANVNRGIYKLSEKATSLYEHTRELVAKYINSDISEVIFTRNTTESINLVMYSWGEENIKKGDTILLTEMEHHSNIVPWVELAKKNEAKIEWVKITPDFRLDINDFKEKLKLNPKIVCVTHVSNVLGTINPINEIIKLAHENDALVLVDAAQSASYKMVDVKRDDIDFCAFSAHKMMGPTGVGVLFVKKDILSNMKPFNYGGDMIREVHKENITWNDIPHKFEAGTPNIADVVVFGRAIEYINNLYESYDIESHENELISHALTSLKVIPGLKIIGPDSSENRKAIFSFTIEGIHPHDVSQILDNDYICVRSGFHCAEVLHDVLGIKATTRASAYFYNSTSDLDKLVEGLIKAREIFKR
jgi:cysteine desulfurase/selenocysteine lyase